MARARQTALSPSRTHRIDRSAARYIALAHIHAVIGQLKTAGVVHELRPVLEVEIPPVSFHHLDDRDTGLPE